MYSIIHVNRRTMAATLEPLGTKRKFWYIDAPERRMLFKAEERGTGEDWAEKIACELAALLGLPHVHYELAHEDADDVPGVVCANCAPRGLTLVHGNELLFMRDPTYPQHQWRYRVREHTVDAVAEAFDTLAPPRTEWMTRAPRGIGSALGIFIGYTMLDAWIANQDRHHENWAALRHADRLMLAPTFDHGAALARNISDAEREERLATSDERRRIPAFAARAASGFYLSADDRKPMPTLAAWRAFAKRDLDAARVWLGQLADLDDRAVESVVENIPVQRMSPIARRFTIQLLRHNRARLLEETLDA